MPASPNVVTGCGRGAPGAVIGFATISLMGAERDWPGLPPLVHRIEAERQQEALNALEAVPRQVHR